MPHDFSDIMIEVLEEIKQILERYMKAYPELEDHRGLTYLYNTVTSTLNSLKSTTGVANGHEDNNVQGP